MPIIYKCLKRNRIKVRSFQSVIFLYCLFCFFSCSKTVEGDLIITNVKIIDVNTGDIESNMDVVIDAEKITSIIQHEDNSNYKAETVIDGTEKFLIPGLWDMHTHTWWGYEDFLPLLLANGITGVREMFGDMETVKKIRNEITLDNIDGPIIISAGDIVDGDPSSMKSCVVAKTSEEGREIVRKQKENGVDFIKVYNSLNREVYFAIADECKKLNMVLAGHIPHKITLEEALNANHASIEHFYGILEYCSDTKGLFLIDSLRKTRYNYKELYKRTDFVNKTYNKSKEKEVIALLSKNNAWVCPTFTVHKGFIRQYDYYYKDDRVDYMPDYAMNGWKWLKESDSILSDDDSRMLNIDKTNYQLMLSLIKPLQDSGVNFLAGSDYANPYTYPGFSLHEELQIMVEEAELTPFQALQTATINPAIFLKKDKEIGSVEIGKLASLVLLNKNPLEDIKNTTTIDAVIVKGKYLEGNKLRAKIEKIAAINRMPKIREVISKIISEEGLDVALIEYQRLKKERFNDYNFNEDQLNTLAYELMQTGRTNDAIPLLEFNVKVFPEYGNGYDSLGDAYVANNDTINAIKAYETAVAKGFNISKSKIEAITKE